MAYDKGYITAPVSIRDVQRCVPVTLKRTNTSTGQVERRSSCDLGVLCSAETGNQITARDGKGTWVVDNRIEINKWAWYKPIKYATIGMLTEAMRKAANYGLFFRENTDAENILKSASPTEAAFNQAASSNYEWSYLRPTGGSTSPYRLTDFVGETNNGGYKHNTKPPFEIFGNWVLNSTELNNVANTLNVIDTGSSYSWAITTYGKIFLGYRMKYNAQPQYDINGPDSMAIPMTYLFGNSEQHIDIATENWRVGMLVLVPASNSRSLFVGLFVSKKTFSASTPANGQNVQDLSVDMCTNQELAFMMNDYMSNKGLTEYSFRALPVLVKNVLLSRSPKQSATDISRTRIDVDASDATKIYPLPTGSVEIGINIVADHSGGEDEDKSVYGTFKLGTKFMSTTYTPTMGYHNVNVLVITSTSAITSAKTAQLDLDYEDMEGTHTLTNSNYTIPANSKFIADGVEYYGVTLAGGLELRVTNVRKFIVS